MKAFSHFSLLEFANETRIKMNVSGRGRSSFDFMGSLLAVNLDIEMAYQKYCVDGGIFSDVFIF